MATNCTLQLLGFPSCKELGPNGCTLYYNDVPASNGVLGNHLKPVTLEALQHMQNVFFGRLGDNCQFQLEAIRLIAEEIQHRSSKP